MSIWHWVAGGVVIALLCSTKGAVRGGILILCVTFAVARVAYLAIT